MTKHDLSRREAIRDFIAYYNYTEGYAPSVREITDAVGLASTSATHHHLVAMVRDGEIRSVPGRMRTWTVANLKR